MPSQIERVKRNDPKYGNRVILSEKQADICMRYMEPRECHGDYGWFTIYHYEITGYSFTLWCQGRYTFLSVSRSGIWAELITSDQREASHAAKIERLKAASRTSTTYKRKVTHLQNWYKEILDELRATVSEYYSDDRDDGTIKDFHALLSAVVEAKEELDAITQ